ncbi:MAG: cytidine deaminase [Elusimicrobia bacterium RIFCSPHIGHO2_02_FULL_57_9]|nr:MAG: cytidine deaminase [Elusimicrobia bacterium RIFCSPHIGHO2_02_FULL_57_9]
MKLSSEIMRLIKAARLARQSAYCPYSRYPVGAAVLTESGRIFSGCNVENASYGLSICAERAAVFNAVAGRQIVIKAVCIAAISPKPCGACRQVLFEFSTRHTAIYLVDENLDTRRPRVTRGAVYKMLPAPFDPLACGLLKDKKR